MFFVFTHARAYRWPTGCGSDEYHVVGECRQKVQTAFGEKTGRTLISSCCNKHNNSGWDKGSRNVGSTFNKDLELLGNRTPEGGSTAVRQSTEAPSKRGNPLALTNACGHDSDRLAFRFSRKELRKNGYLATFRVLHPDRELILFPLSVVLKRFSFDDSFYLSSLMTLLRR